MRPPRNLRRHNIIGSIALGLMVLPAGLYFLNTADVNCDNRPMKRGDICQEWDKGRTVTYTYEQRRAYWQRMGWLGTVGGVVAFGAAGWFTVRGRGQTSTAQAR